jgi:hypothetical protein
MVGVVIDILSNRHSNGMTLKASLRFWPTINPAAKKRLANLLIFPYCGAPTALLPATNR